MAWRGGGFPAGHLKVGCSWRSLSAMTATPRRCKRPKWLRTQRAGWINSAGAALPTICTRRRCGRAIAPMGHRKEMSMSEKRTVEKAQRAKRAGKAATTQAGEFVRDGIRKIRHGAHGARSTQQVIAIGLSEARRSGVALPPPKEGRAKEQTRRSAKYAYEAGQHKRKTRRRPRVSRAVSRVLEHEPRSSASPEAMSRQAKRAASRRTATQRSAAAHKAVRTKGAAGRSAAARRAAQTRARRKG